MQRGLTGFIKLTGVHNHSTANAEALSYLTPSAHLRSVFEGLLTDYSYTAGLIMQFLRVRRYASVGLCDSNVSVRPSLCLSRAGIVETKKASVMISSPSSSPTILVFYAKFPLDILWEPQTRVGWEKQIGPKLTYELSIDTKIDDLG